jgi:catechol 2,3-dioxygenase-like lactoylglutathione lyase family enzyme
MAIQRFDHVAMPIERVEEMMAFYASLGFRVEDHAPSHYSVHFGGNKINMHAPELWRSGDFTLRGPTATPGCGDFCFVWQGTVPGLEAELSELSIPIETGPVSRAGGAGPGTSVYVRDPDENLLEFIVYEGGEAGN